MHVSASTPLIDMFKQDNNTLSIDIDSYSHEAIDFAHLCNRALQAHKARGRIALHQLPHDISRLLTIAAWNAGWSVAFIPSGGGALTYRHMLNILNADIIVDAYSSPLALQLKEMRKDRSSTPLFLSLNDETEAQNLFSWLEMNSEPETIISHFWQDDETALILFTSGSTGLPKGVCHSLQSAFTSAQRFIKQFDITDKDRLFNTALLHTASGFRCTIMLPLLAGCTVNEEPVHAELQSLLTELHQQKATVIIVGPSLIRQISKLAPKLKHLKNHLKIILCTGAKLETNDKQNILQHLSIPVLNWYGLTEAGGIVIAESLHTYNASSVAVGAACYDIDTRVLDTNNQEQTTGTGELRIYGPGLLLDYLGLSTEKPAAQPKKSSNYFDTGDVVSIDANGSVTWQYRINRSIKDHNTEWLHPEFIESWVLSNTEASDIHVETTTCANNKPTLVAHIAGICATQWLEWKQNTHSSISLALGKKYESLIIKQAKVIERSSLGKIKLITPSI